jgi:hypothetical protein
MEAVISCCGGLSGMEAVRSCGGGLSGIPAQEKRNGKNRKTKKKRYLTIDIKIFGIMQKNMKVFSASAKRHTYTRLI